MFARNKVLKHTILVLLLISALPLIVYVSSGNASATTPPLSIQPFERYNYTAVSVWGAPVQNLTTNADWLLLSGFTVTGRPLETDIGVYFVHLTFYDFTYQNYTLDVRWTHPMPPPMQTGVALVFGFGLLVLSVVDKDNRIWSTFAGLAWFMIAVVALYPVGMGWMILGIGIGLIMWVKGTMEYVKSRRQGT